MSKKIHSSTPHTGALLPDRSATWTGYTALLLLLGALIYSGASQLRFDTHDQDYLRDSADGLQALLSPDKRMPGRPAFELLLWGFYQLWGNAPRPYHIAGIALHVLASLALAYACRRLGTPLNTALISGLLFLFNLAHFRAVHWISAHCYIEVFLCCALGVVFYVSWMEQGRLRWVTALCLVALIGTLAHVTAAIVLPFCLYLHWHRSQPLRTAWPLLLLLVLLALASGWIKAYYATAPQLTILAADLDLMARGQNYALLFSRLWTTAHWLWVPLHQVEKWEWLLGVPLVLGTLGGCVQRRGLVTIWSVWILLSFLPFLMIASSSILGTSAGPSRYLYLASAGTSALLALVLSKVERRAARTIGQGGAYFLHGVLLVGILASSALYLRKTEAISYYASSRYYSAQGELDEGVAQMRRAIDQAPEVLPLEESYARLIAQLFGTEDVQAVIDEALAIFPDNVSFLTQNYILKSVNPDSSIRAFGQQKLDVIRKYIPRRLLQDHTELMAISYHNIGAGLYIKNDIEGAIHAYHKALEVAPDRLNTQKGLANAFFVLQRWEEAQSLLPPDSHANLDDPSSLYLHALRAAFEGRIDEAIKLCQLTLDLKPSGEIFHLLSHCYAEKGQLEDALESLHQAIDLAGDQVSYRTYFQLGTLYYRAGQFEQAVAAYRQSTRLDSRDFEPYADLGAALMELGRLEEAEQAYRQALVIHPRHPKLHYNLGRLKLEQGDRREATKAFETAVQKGSDDIHAYWALGRLYWQADQHQQALEVFRQLVQLDLQGDSEIYTQVGVLFNERGEVDHAIQAYDKALTLDSSKVEARVNLGWLYYTRGKFEAAIAAYHQVLDQQPHSVAQFSLGLAYLHQGQIEAARATYARGIEQFGRDEAEKTGAVKDLQTLIARGLRAAEAKEILDTYWHE